MGLQQNLNNIQTNLLAAKTAIAQSISNKGVECSADDKLSSFAEKIDSITTGSTGGTGDKIMLTNGTKFAYSTAFDPTLYDVSNITDMSEMFYRCSGLTGELDVSSWDVSNVTNMGSMFSFCLGLTSLDLSTWNLGNVYIALGGMFNNCTSLANLQLNDLGHHQSCTSLDLSTCSALTKDSILFLFNNAFDRATAGYTSAFTIKLNAATKALLTEDEIAIATNKGFTVV